MRVALIKATICVIVIISVISLGIVSISNSEIFATTAIHNEDTIDEATIDEATIDEATIDEVLTMAETTMATEFIEQVTEQPTTEKSTEKLTEEPTEIATEEIAEVQKETESIIEKETENSSDYLLSIDNPDYNYSPQAYSLSDSEKYNVACVVMGEFGGGGFTGCALIAQAIRDAMQTYGYSVNSAISNMGYYGYNGSPNSDSYAAVDYIFSGNAAVQHRILYMNNTYSAWHESQNFIVQYENVRFFDAW